MGLFTLYVQYSGRAPESKSFDSELVVVGRDAGDMVMLDPQVSSRHAELRFVGGKLMYRDLGSTNGSYLENGMRIFEAVELGIGNTIRVGQSAITVQHIDFPGATQRGKTVFAGSAPSGRHASLFHRPTPAPGPSSSLSMKPTLMFHGNQQGTPVRQTAPQHHLPAPTGTMPFGSGAPRQVPGAPASVGYGAAGQGHNGAEQPSATVNFAGPTSGGPPGSNHVAAFAGQMPGGIESHAGHRSPNGHAPSQGFGQQQAPSQGFGHTAGSSQSFGQQLGSHPSFGGPQAVPSGPSAYHPPAGHYPGSTSPPVAPSLPPEPLLMGGEFTQSSGAVEDIRRGFKLLVGNLGIASAPALAVGVLAYLLTAFAGSLGGVLALPFNLLLPLAIAAGWHVLLQSYLNRTVDFKLALRSVFKLGIGRIASIYVLMLIAGLTLWIPFGFFLPVILFGERNKLFENAARNWGLVSRDIVRPIAICVLCAFALAIASLPLMVLGAFVPAIAALTYAVISIFAGLLVSATAIPLYFQVRQLAEGGDIRLAVREHLRAPARVAAPTRPPSAGFDGGVALPQGGGQPFHQPLYGQQGGYPHQPGGGVPHGANNTAYPQHGAGFGGAPHHYGAAPGPQPSFPPTGGYPPS